MPKQKHIKSILIIGSGPIVIGQACEFDYAGTQACKALRAEGYRIILINSNPATIMTDTDIADAVYIEPITENFVTEIIKKERPDALLPTLGGQTALNCALALAKSSVLERYQVELIGASIKAIEMAEDREQFRQLLTSLGLATPISKSFYHLTELISEANELQYPVIIRSSFSLGGTGAALVDHPEALITLSQQIFSQNKEAFITVDQALVGWKEIELEVMRDTKDNCIVVCGIENINPLGVHTGDSMTVSPIQTLTDKEYQNIRNAAFTVLRALGIDTGGCNVQFAINPKTGEVMIIEMNPRVSRSSALVSKASGFPIAKIAAKLAVGFTLDELYNDITSPQLPASFEPSLDYVVVKIPRFHFEKFPGVQPVLGPQMQSVGEAMAIGRTFTEALQKAMRSMELRLSCDENKLGALNDAELAQLISVPTPMLVYGIEEALQRGWTIYSIANLTHIDPWFLSEINNMVTLQSEISLQQLSKLPPENMLSYKRAGFSDLKISTLLQCDESAIRNYHQQYEIKPVYKRIDSCAGEFQTATAYLYSTYETQCEAYPSQKPKIIIIGSGPNRIGQGIEFDYCCVHAAKALRKLGYETIMLNCNPETVSTDYDIVDRLYCTPLTFEDVYHIIQCEQPQAVLVSFGGQTPLNLASQLAAHGINLLGITDEIIQKTEDRKQFQALLQELELQQPNNTAVHSLAEGITAAKILNYPVIVRPSFVLGGSAMKVIGDQQALIAYLEKLYATKQEHPILIETFLQDAVEIDVDAICDGDTVFIPALLEHIEEAGVHSGDSACITPPVVLSLHLQNEIKRQTHAITHKLGLHGIVNIQFAVVNSNIFVLEVNPRASRTVPFIAKVTQLPIIDWVIESMLGHKPLAGLNIKTRNQHYYVKESVLPFTKFLHTSSLLGPEMRSTGEVMGIGKVPAEAYAKAQIAAGNNIPHGGNVWLVCTDLCPELKEVIHQLQQLNFQTHINGERPEQCALIIAIQQLGFENNEVAKAARYAVDHNICYVTSKRSAQWLCQALDYQQHHQFSVNALQTLQKQQSVQHLLTGLELTCESIKQLLSSAIQLKTNRYLPQKKPLADKHLTLLFDKPSLRTRSSFTVAMRELGGDVIESNNTLRKTEAETDQIQVLGGYCQGIVVRTDCDKKLAEMADVSPVPIINGLTDLHHPCQILADLMTLVELFGSLEGLNLAYIGDGNNILHSLLLIAARMGVNIHYACPATREPNQAILLQAEKLLTNNTIIKRHPMPQSAVTNADVVYTDVWTSMGFENTVAEELFAGYQINDALMAHAKNHAVFMHCLPMVRGKEVSHTVADGDRSVIFRQSENRLHIQKAILMQFLMR